MSTTTTMTEPTTVSLEGLDAEQVRLMEERLILLDRDDNVVGEGSKKECTSSML
jgi:isopentenyl-diphosphate delta-isomerase